MEHVRKLRCCCRMSVSPCLSGNLPLSRSGISISNGVNPLCLFIRTPLFLYEQNLWPSYPFRTRKSKEMSPVLPLWISTPPSLHPGRAVRVWWALWGVMFCQAERFTKSPCFADERIEKSRSLSERGFVFSEFSLDSPGVFFYSPLAVWINGNNTFAIYLVNRNIFVYPKISGPVASQRGDIVKVSDQQKSALQTILFCKQIKSHLAPCCNISEQYFTMNIVEVRQRFTSRLFFR